MANATLRYRINSVGDIKHSGMLDLVSEKTYTTS